MQHHDPSQDPESAPTDHEPTQKRAEEAGGAWPRCELRDVSASCQSADSPRRFYEF
jgi:hypothetical protein